MSEWVECTGIGDSLVADPRYSSIKVYPPGTRKMKKSCFKIRVCCTPYVVDEVINPNLNEV